MWKRFAPRDAIGKAFQLEYTVKRIIYLKTKEQKNKRAFLLLRYVRR